MEFRDKQIASPRLWERFEDLCLSLFKTLWKDDLAQKHGRSGQSQHGVDIFGSPEGRRDITHGVQCKGKDQTYGHKATLAELRSEIEKAECFRPPLQDWTFATTAPRDAKLQLAAREISQERWRRGQFTVTVLGWEDICSLLAEFPRVAEAFYPEHAFNLHDILATLQALPKGEDLRALMAYLTAASGHGHSAGLPAPVWTPVHFEQARDLGPALMGRSLGPADVAACPLLPEAQAIVAELQRAFALRLIGESGAGKSVCALQAARMFASRGWRVVRLLDPAVSSLELETAGEPTLFLIDDAHLTPAPVLQAAEEKADRSRLLLTTYNALEQSSAGSGSIRLDAKRAVRVIAAGLRANLSDTLRVVRRVDDRVGDRPQDELLELRLDHAEREADRPWQFCFILGGGWRRAGQAADNARAAGADFVLAASAIRQIASRDARCTREALLSLLSAAGLDSAQPDAAFDWLVRQRLAIAPDDLRCPHQRFAIVVLGRILQGQDAQGRQAIGGMLGAIFNDPEMPLAGLYVLLRELRFTGDFARWTYLVEAGQLNLLIERCWSPSSAEDRMYALLVLNELDGYIAGWPRSVLESRVDQLASWISNPADPVGYGAGRLMNSVYSRDKELAADIRARADPVQVAAAVSAATAATAYSLAELMKGIHPSSSPDWKAAFDAALDRKACLKLAANWPSVQPMSAFVEFCEVFVSERDGGFALDLAEAFLPRTAKPLTDDPVRAFQELTDLAWHILRILDPLGSCNGYLAPTKRMKSLARHMCTPLQPVVLAEKLSAVQKRDIQTAAFLLTFLRNAAPSKYQVTVAALDWSKIEATIGDDWPDVLHDAEVFLGVCFAGAPSCRPAVEAMIERNLRRIVRLPPRLALIAPSAGYHHVEAGRAIGLSGFGHFQWEEAVRVVARFALDRPHLVERLLAPHEQAAGAVLSNRDPSWYQKATLFIHVVRQLAPASFERMLSAVNAGAAEEGWAATLRAKGDGRRVVALLIENAIERTDALGAMARRLRQRFPRRSKPLPKDVEPIVIGTGGQAQ